MDNNQNTQDINLEKLEMNRNMNFYFCNLKHSDDERNKANIIFTDLRLSKHETKYRFSLFLIENF